MHHQGRRSVAAIRPYTYILFTRAMDLYDVSQNRGSVVTALEQRPLPHAGGGNQFGPAVYARGCPCWGGHPQPSRQEVDYAEIRSPHGHDAFLLEIDQLFFDPARCLGSKTARGPDLAQRELRTVRLGILGAGRVTGMFLRLLAQRQAQILEDYGLRLEVAAVADVDRSRTLDPELGPMETRSSIRKSWSAATTSTWSWKRPAGATRTTCWR